MRRRPAGNRDCAQVVSGLPSRIFRSAAALGCHSIRARFVRFAQRALVARDRTGRVSDVFRKGRAASGRLPWLCPQCFAGGVLEQAVRSRRGADRTVAAKRGPDARGGVGVRPGGDGGRRMAGTAGGDARGGGHGLFLAIGVLFWFHPMLWWHAFVAGEFPGGYASPWHVVTVLSLQTYALVALFAMGIAAANEQAAEYTQTEQPSPCP